MGFLDKALKTGKEAANKAKGFAADHTEQVKGAIDKAEGLADKATKGKYTEKIEKAGEKADAAVNKLKKADTPRSDVPQDDPQDGPQNDVPPTTTG